MKKNLWQILCLIVCVTVFVCGFRKIDTGSDMDSDMDHKLNVIFTVDVEDNRGNIPYLIEGDLTAYGIKENCGVNYIMDTFESYDSKAVFFVNIYEHHLYEETYMPSLLSRISGRGHEVALHAHNPSDQSLDFYTKSMKDCSLEEQKTILEYGRNYIYDAVGKYPAAYRAGAYGTNDSLFQALSETGFSIDSSVYYGHKNNQFQKFNGLRNQIFQADGITEIPVETVFGSSGWRKLDIDSMSEEDILKTLDMMRKSGLYHTVQIMFHSFSCLELDQAGSEILYQDGNRAVCGEDSDTKNKLNHILKYLSESDQYEIITFEDYQNMDAKIPAYQQDNLIYLGDRNLAFEKKNVAVFTDGSTVYMKNDVLGENLKYAWVIRRMDDPKDVYESGYSSKNEYEMVFPEEADGVYSVTSYLKNDKNRKAGALFYKITVKHGKVTAIDDY